MIGPAHGKLAVADGGEVRRAPLDRLDLNAPAGDVAVAAGIRPAGIEALQRVEGEGERFEVQFDEIEGVLGGGLVRGGYGENGLGPRNRVRW